MAEVPVGNTHSNAFIITGLALIKQKEIKYNLASSHLNYPRLSRVILQLAPKSRDRRPRGPGGQEKDTNPAWGSRCRSKVPSRRDALRCFPSLSMARVSLANQPRRFGSRRPLVGLGCNREGAEKANRPAQVPGRRRRKPGAAPEAGRPAKTRPRCALPQRARPAGKDRSEATSAQRAGWPPRLSLSGERALQEGL